MGTVRQAGRVNVRALAILVSVVVLLGLGAVSARYIRKRVIASQALVAGKAAFEREDWAVACEQFRRYLTRRPNDQTENRHIEILEKYAQALLRVRPLSLESTAAAVAAYRRLLRLDPARESTYEALADLYIGARDFSELAYVARKRREQTPDDPKAAIWMATAGIAERKLDEARHELETLITQFEPRADKHGEYVVACAMLSGIAAQEGSAERHSQALEWLSRAVKYDPRSVAALVQRARFYRLNPGSVGADRSDCLAAARQDLEAASALTPANLEERLVLYREWLEHGDFDQAQTQLQAIEAVDETTLKETFASQDDWLALRFLLKANLLLQTRAAVEGADLADEALAVLKHQQHRTRVLPLAIRLYLAAQRTADARRCLDEYREAVVLSAGEAGPHEMLGLLEAFLAQAEGQPYRVIGFLEPLRARGSSDANVMRLLAEAYSQTNQDRRAARVLEDYLADPSRPYDSKAALQLARAQIKAGKLDEAIRLAGSVEAEIPDATLVRIEAQIRAAAQQLPSGGAETLETVATQLQRLCDANPGHVGVRVMRASVAGYLNQTQAAEQILRAAIRDCADPLPAEMMLAQLYFQTRRVDKALEVARSACERHHEVLTPWLARLDMLELLQRYADVRQTLEAALAALTSPSARREVEIRLALFDLLYDDRAAGIRRLQALADQDPTDVRLRSKLLDLPEIGADSATADKLIGELRHIQGESGLLWRVHQAGLWLSTGQWESKQQETQELLEHCSESDPGWSTPALLLGKLHTRLERLDQAERVYRRTLAANPSAVAAADRLLDLLQQQKRFADALQILDQLESRARINPKQRVGILLGAGEVNKAIEELRLRVTGDPDDVDSRIHLARLIYQRTRNAALAFEYLDEAEALAPDSTEITFVRGVILRSEGRLEEARRLLDVEVERKQSFEAYFLRARFLTSIGELELAEQDCIRLSQFADRPEGHLLLGTFYTETGRSDEALATWERGLSAYPENTALKRELTMLLLARAEPGSRQRGLKLLAELEEAYADDPELLWARAMLALEEGTTDALRAAEELLRQIVELQPTAVDAHLKLIQLAMQRDDPAAARELAILALGSNPKDVRILLARAEAERALGNVDTARVLAQLILKENPREAEVLSLLAQLALGSNTPATLAEAQELLERALSDGVSDRRLQTDLLLVLEAQGESERVNTILEEVRQGASPRDGAAMLLALCELHWQRGQFDMLHQRVEQAARIAPDEPRVLRMRIGWLAGQKEFNQIVELMQGERPNPPYTPEVLSFAGALLTSSGEPGHQQVALELFESALQQRPLDSDLLSEIAARLYQADEVDRAVEVYRQVIEEDPKNARALNDLAWVLAEALNAYEQALRYANRGLSFAPDDVHLLDTRGVILSNLPGRLEEARRDFERCVELKRPGTPSKAKALLQLARVSARLNDKLAALRCLREALEIDQQHDGNVFTKNEHEEIRKLRTQIGAD